MSDLHTQVLLYVTQMINTRAEAHTCDEDSITYPKSSDMSYIVLVLGGGFSFLKCLYSDELLT